MQSISKRLVIFTLMLVGTLAATGRLGSVEARERLEQPLPRTALNGAIHYQRAILFLSAVDPAKRVVLQKPIWEIVTPETSEAEIAELNQLLIESRHAIRSALVGSNQSVADFGLDIRQYMVSALIPHNQSMVDMGRLVTLHGMHREFEGRWKEAAEIYFATLRMGRHMTHQTTLAETFAGVEILETAYFALGYWAANCPDEELVEEALDLLATFSHDLVHPAKTLQSEANIIKLRMQTIKGAYPDGPWAEMVLEALEADIPSADPAALRKAAVKAAVERGVPKEAFESKELFVRYMDKQSSIYLDLANETALCMTRTPAESIVCGEAVSRKYKNKLIKNQNTSVWKPAKIASLFAVHEAELTVMRACMAVSAKSASGYPAKLSEVADLLGGSLPTSPYDGSPLNYETLEDGKGFSLSVSAAKVGTVELPEIKFLHLPK
jgi:hypothetical protein